MDELKKEFIKKTITLSLCILVSGISIGLCIWLQPFQENATGLGWIHGHLFTMSWWALLSCGLNAWLSWHFFKREGKLQKARQILGIWIGLIIGCLVPYHQGAIAFLGDLHSLICVICIGCWVIEWVKELTFYSSFSLEYQVSKKLMILFGFCLFLCGLTQGICFLAEALFVCAQAWILWNALYGKSFPK